MDSSVSNKVNNTSLYGLAIKQAALCSQIFGYTVAAKFSHSGRSFVYRPRLIGVTCQQHIVSVKGRNALCTLIRQLQQSVINIRTNGLFINTFAYPVN
jgi:hypothetical protein